MPVISSNAYLPDQVEPDADPFRDNGDAAPSFVLPPPLSWEDLGRPVDMSENLLGNRFLEAGQGLILYGPAGCGKSVAAMQGAAEWSAGLAGLHITPAHPLKVVVLQTEDSLNDLRESLHGILASSVFTPELLDLVHQNLVILPPVPGGNRRDLRLWVEQSLIAHTPHLILVNPLLAFCDSDPTKDLGGILYQDVDPIIKRHHAGFLGVHHTPKMNNRDTSGYGAHDHQYLAAGDARVANWPRSMVFIEPVGPGIYRFRLTKRASRGGWTWDGKPVFERYFKHGKNEVRWLDASPEDVENAKAIEHFEDILAILPAPDTEGISRDLIRHAAKNKLGIGKDKADAWTKLAVETQLAERVARQNPDTNRTEARWRRTGSQ